METDILAIIVNLFLFIALFRRIQNEDLRPSILQIRQQIVGWHIHKHLPTCPNLAFVIKECLYQGISTAYLCTRLSQLTTEASCFASERHHCQRLLLLRSMVLTGFALLVRLCLHGLGMDQGINPIDLLMLAASPCFVVVFHYQAKTLYPQHWLCQKQGLSADGIILCNAIGLQQIPTDFLLHKPWENLRAEELLSGQSLRQQKNELIELWEKDLTLQGKNKVRLFYDLLPLLEIGCHGLLLLTSLFVPLMACFSF